MSTVIGEIFVRTIDLRVSVRTIMIGNSYVEIGKMFIETIRYIGMRHKN